MDSEQVAFGNIHLQVVLDNLMYSSPCKAPALTQSGGGGREDWSNDGGGSRRWGGEDGRVCS